MPALHVLSGSSRTRRIGATAVAVCGLMLLAAAPGWAKGTIQWHGCGPELPSNLQCGELAVPLDYGDPRGANITLGFRRNSTSWRHGRGRSARAVSSAPARCWVTWTPAARHATWRCCAARSATGS
jgi:hypothetical protein